MLITGCIGLEVQNWGCQNTMLMHEYCNKIKINCKVDKTVIGATESIPSPVQDQATIPDN